MGILTITMMTTSITNASASLCNLHQGKDSPHITGATMTATSFIPLTNSLQNLALMTTVTLGGQAIKNFQNTSNTTVTLPSMKKEFFNIANDNGFLDRRNTKETGLPNCALIIGNQNVQYGPILKKWNCLICNYARDKYNWKQVLRHANSKHKNIIPINNTPRRPKGMRVEKTNDITLKMETDYGESECKSKSIMTSKPDTLYVSSVITTTLQNAV